MRSVLLIALVVWCIDVTAQQIVPGNSSGAETVTSLNATALGFTVELSPINAGVRVRIVLPDPIHNGFEYAYTRIQLNDRNEVSVLTIRPDVYEDFLTKSRYLQFFVPNEILSCLGVTLVYLNPESPMHSDYFMDIDLATFLESDPMPCALERVTEPN